MMKTGPKNLRLTAVLLTAALLFAGNALVPTGGALGQTMNFGADTGKPVEIFAENGIEWQQEKLIFLARGNAKAVKGDVTVKADELRAYYREHASGGSDIWRLDAIGKVKISTPGQTAFGEKGIYDVDNAILVLSGGRQVRLKTATDEITANHQLEFWEKKQMAVARGNAQVVREDKNLRADVLAAYFRTDKNGKSKVHRVEAFDNVKIVTKEDTVLADRGVYNVESGIATLTGSVRIDRAGTKLAGCSARVNLNTGISKLQSCGPGAGGNGRVQGFIQPRNVKKK